MENKPQSIDNAAVVSEIGAYTWIDRKKTLEDKRTYWVFKRAQDIFFSALALIVLSPLLLVLALVIWIDSPGASPIFAQDRVGRDGKIFRFLNVRCMGIAGYSARNSCAVAA